MFKRIHITLCALMLFVSVKAQVTIRGKAPDYKGQEITCTRYADYMSFELVEMGRCIVGTDGKFSLTIDLKETSQIQLQCDASTGILYADPNATYDVIVNAADSTNENAYMRKIRVDFDTLQTYDINNLVLDFASRHDDFMFYNFTLIGKPKFTERLDTFKLYLSKVYKNVKHPFFLNYVAYSVAQTEMLGPARKDEDAFQQYMYEQYFKGKAVLYGNDLYMSFFTKYYADIFKMVTVTDELALYHAINKYGSYTMAKRILRKDYTLSDERINELALIQSLSQEYFNIEFDKEMIAGVLDSIAGHSKFEEHRLIAANVKERLTYMNRGSQFPGFALLDSRDSLITPDKFKGKFLYIMFWSIDNTPSLNDMKIMKRLYDEYKWDFEFISINVDDDPAIQKNFLKKNGYQWTFLHYGKDKKIRLRYKAATLPEYYLVDPNGVFLQSPALKPSTNSTHQSIEETMFRIHKRLHPEKKIVPGQKEN